MTEEESALSTLERLVRWGIEQGTSTMGRLSDEGGYTHTIAYYRGRISGFNTVLDLIEWYSLDIQSSETSTRDEDE